MGIGWNLKMVFVVGVDKLISIEVIVVMNLIAGSFGPPYILCSSAVVFVIIHQTQYHSNSILSCFPYHKIKTLTIPNHSSFYITFNYKFDLYNFEKVRTLNVMKKLGFSSKLEYFIFMVWQYLANYCSHPIFKSNFSQPRLARVAMFSVFLFWFWK